MARHAGFVFLLLALFGAGAPAARAASAVVIRAEGYVELLDFYRFTLGLPVLEEDRGAGRAVLDADGTRLVLLRGGAKGRGAEGPRLLIGVADLEAARALLDARNLAYVPARDPAGATLGYFFSDPEGNPLGFVRRDLPATAWLAPLGDEAIGRARLDSGRVRLMVWGGVYGLWLGLALPVGLGSGDPTVIGLGMLAGGPLGVLAASEIAKHSNLDRGRADFIAFAGGFGTGQGLGWAADGDAEGEDVVLAGALAGLGAVIPAIALTEDGAPSEGQAAVLGSAAGWGAWYGLIGPLIVGGEDEEASLSAVLIGSAAGVVAGGIWAIDHDVAVNRARLISLGGVVGTGAGFGLDLILRVDDSSTAFALAAAGGILGKIAAVAWTRPRTPPSGALQEPALALPLLVGADGRGSWRVEVARARF